MSISNGYTGYKHKYNYCHFISNKNKSLFSVDFFLIEILIEFKEIINKI